MMFIEYGVVDQPFGEPVKLYARVDDDGVIRMTCIEENSEYQAWLASQNEE